MTAAPVSCPRCGSARVFHSSTNLWKCGACGKLTRTTPAALAPPVSRPPGGYRETEKLNKIIKNLGGKLTEKLVRNWRNWGNCPGGFSFSVSHQFLYQFPCQLLCFVGEFPSFSEYTLPAHARIEAPPRDRSCINRLIQVPTQTQEVTQ